MMALFFSACSLLLPNFTSVDESHQEADEGDSFQEYLWQEHPLDLIIQIGLLLAGAFSVAALLPAPDEE